MKTITTTGFAGVNIWTVPPHIMAWSTRGTAGQARKAVAENWPDGATEAERWKAAYRAGVRIRKVQIATR